MAGQRIGYVRVSTFEQNAQRRLDEIPVDRVFIDQASGKDTQRPQLETMLAFVREGDSVVVHSMDRLARNLDDLRRLVQLMVVLREMEGANKKDAELRPVGKVTATIDGKVVEINPAWLSLIGDMHIRFVYDSPATMRGLSEEDLKGLHLSPDQALRVAVQNIKRTYGKPHYRPWEGGLFIVEGDSPDPKGTQSGRSVRKY